MPIYTRKGDAGQTSLNPYTSKTSKSSLQIAALGEVDELQAYLGVCRASCHPTGDHPQGDKVRDLGLALQKIQSTLFRVLAHVGRDTREKIAVPVLSNDHVRELENMIAYFEKKLPPVTKFIMSGNSRLGTMLSYARTVCRRAERAVVAYQEEKIALDPQVLQYMNRLSSVLYIMSREADRVAGISTELPDYYASSSR